MQRRATPARGVKPVRPEVSALLREHLTIRRALRRRGVRPEDVEDLVQEVVVAAWVAAELGRYAPDPAEDPRAALRRWLTGIARNLASHHVGRASVRYDVATDPAAFERMTGPSPERRLSARADLALVRVLAPGFREVLAAMAGGATHAEAASLLGEPASTVGKRFYRARAALLRALRRG